MKKRVGFRKIVVNGKTWQYKIGRSNVVAFDEDGNKKLDHVDVVAKGYDVWRARWKKCQVLGPKEVADWISGNIQSATEPDPGLIAEQDDE